MYQYAYQEIIEDSSVEARDREGQAFTEAIRLLDEAVHAGAGSACASRALRFNEDLWMILVEDLAHPENKLPETLRASIISIGIWVLKEIGRIRCGQSNGFRAISEINSILRDGLHQG